MKNQGVTRPPIIKANQALMVMIPTTFGARRQTGPRASLGLRRQRRQERDGMAAMPYSHLQSSAGGVKAGAPAKTGARGAWDGIL